MYRRRLELRAARGRPVATLTVGDSGGRLCYVTAALGAMAIAVPLEDDDVDQLVAALTSWRRDRDDDARPSSRRLCSPAQTAGVHTRGTAEAFTGVNTQVGGASEV